MPENSPAHIFIEYTFSKFDSTRYSGTVFVQTLKGVTQIQKLFRISKSLVYFTIFRYKRRFIADKGPQFGPQVGCSDRLMPEIALMSTLPKFRL